MELEIKALSPELKKDYLSFFDGIAFEEHPHWADCYCYSFHFTGKAEEWQREKNRSCVASMIEKNTMKGYLAYDKGLPVGWCNANNRLNYQLLTQSFDLVDPGHAKICSIVCFLIHPDYRRMGIVKHLLDRIIKDYKAMGYAYIEAYPGTGNLSAEKLYRGPLHLYERLGFARIKESQEHVVVRLRL
jgi:ribosomal protein S18 acetylase RimI-like enzyme